MAQPQSIKRFDIFYLASLAVYAIGFFLGYDDTVRLLHEQYAQAGLNINAGGIATGSFIFGVAIGLLLWWFVSSRRSVVAKWILVVFFLLSLLGLVIGASTMFASFGIAQGLSLLSVVLSGVAIYYLFQPDTKPWFEKEPKA